MKKLFLFSLFLLFSAPWLMAQTMSFSSGASEPGFTFNGWTSAGGTIWHANLASPASCSINSGTWNFTSFTVGPFTGSNTYQVTSNLGDSYTYSGASTGTHTLNWTGVTTVTFTRISGSGSAADHDNFVYSLAPSCTDPDAPSGLTATASTICSGSTTTLSWSGNLNSATNWHVYEGACGTDLVGTTASNSITVSPSSTTTYFIRGEDGAACVDEASQSCASITITVGDDVAPVISCLADQSLNSDIDCQATLPDYTNSVTVTDNCSNSPVVTQVPAPGTLISSSTLVTITADDGNGNTSDCSFSVELDDNMAPTINCPADQNEVLSADCEFIVPDYTGLATVDDNCSASIALTQSPVAGTIVSTNTLITLTADDGNGNTSNCDFTLTLSDETAPTAVCENASVYVDGMGSASITAADIDGGSSDACSSITMDASLTAFNCSDLGPNEVELTVTDESMNSATCSAIVTVIDTISPDFSCIDDQTIPVGGSCAISIPDFTTMITSTDNCSNAPEVTQFPTAGSVVFENTVVTVSATDASGNTTDCSFNVFLEDNIAPDAACQKTIVYLDETGNGTLTTSQIDDGSIDNCSEVTLVASTTAFSCNDLGMNSVTLTVSDESGNTSTCLAEVMVLDTLAPTTNPIAPISVECAGDIPDPNTEIITGESDNCSDDVTVSYLFDASDGESCPETISRTYRVVDGNGNSAFVIQLISVHDTTDPIPEANSLEKVFSECAIEMPAAPIATDNCAGIVSGVPNVSFPIVEEGTTLVTWTFMDDCGNSSVQTQEFEVAPIETDVVQMDELTLMVEAEGYDYQWVNCLNDYEPILGATSQTFTPMVAGSYACEISNGVCTVMSDCYGTSLSTDEIQSVTQLQVYPNPTQGNLSVKMGDVYQTVEVRVFNSLGQVIMQESYQETGEISFEIDGESGIYILEVQADQNPVVRTQLIKK